MRKRPAIPRVDGGTQTVLLVEDVARAEEFYAKSLLLVRKDGDAGRYAEFDTGDGGTLVLVKRDGSIAPLAALAATEDGVTLTFTIAETGLDTWKRWFTRRGIPIERETKWIHGGRSLFIRDPDRRRLEFKTPPKLLPPKPVTPAPSSPKD